MLFGGGALDRAYRPAARTSATGQLRRNCNAGADSAMAWLPRRHRLVALQSEAKPRPYRHGYAERAGPFRITSLFVAYSPAEIFALSAAALSLRSVMLICLADCMRICAIFRKI
jgi:hypothetical protein